MLTADDGSMYNNGQTLTKHARLTDAYVWGLNV